MRRRERKEDQFHDKILVDKNNTKRKGGLLDENHYTTNIEQSDRQNFKFLQIKWITNNFPYLD